MFTDEMTNIKIHASLDETVIRATHRPQDLIPAFLEVIKETPEYQSLMFNCFDFIPNSALEDEDHEWWNSNECSDLANQELFDILNKYTPSGYYFGAHLGDGSDFGFWKINEDEF